MARFCARVRKRADLPSVSMKDVYAHPTVRGLAGALGPQASPLEQPFAQVLAEVLGVGEVPVDGHFFDDLGADSMVMARFCARVRKRPDLPTVSMKDVYRHPTISSLADGAVAPSGDGPDRCAGLGTGRAGGSTGGHGALHPVRDAAVPVLRRRRLPRRPGDGVVVRVGVGGIRSVRDLPQGGGGRWRRLPGCVPVADPREVGVDRPVDTEADPGLEPGVPPLLDRQDTGPVQPAASRGRRPVAHQREFVALRAVPARPGREDRPERRDLLPDHAGLHRPAHHRRRHGDPEGRGVPRLPRTCRRDPHRRDHARQGRRRRRAGRSRHRHLAGRRGPAGSRLLTASGAGRARRRALARLTGAAHRRGLPVGRTGPLRRRAEGHPRGDAVADRTAGVPAADDGRRGLRPRRLPTAHRARHRTAGLHHLDVLSGRPDRVGRAVLRFPRRWPARGVHGSPRAQPRDQAGHGLPPLRLPLLDPPDDRAAHQCQILHLPVRGQLLHRPLPARPGIRPVDRRADRIQFRHRRAPRDPVPRLGGARNDGRRRAVGHQRRLLQHILPAVPGVHRGPQLPRQLHRLSRPEPCRRELSARHEGPDSRSTGRSATASGCSARPASRSRAPSPGTADSARGAARSCGAGSASRTGTTCAPWPWPCWCGGSTSSG